MIFAFLLLLTGLTISAVAIYYSVIGLTAIFAAAFWPIVIMGATLEVAKLVCASWLKANWERIPKLMKAYMTSAVVVLMFLTSMGIFGFLSKAHLDQNLISGDVVDRVAIIDEKIRTQKDNIESARKALRQMDEAVDQTMARSSSEQGADKAAALRRSQQRERANLQNDITKAQAAIAKLNEERAPIAKDLRKVEAEVGPIKYIAKLIYGDNPDANLLEKAVTWVIIVIVVVFDPLAVIMLLAAQMTFAWAREQKQQDEYPTIADLDRDVGEPPTAEEKLDPFISVEVEKPVEPAPHHPDTHPYLRQGFKVPEGWQSHPPIVAKAEEEATPEVVSSVERKLDIIHKLHEEVQAPLTVDTTEVKVDEPTYKILPELEEESKKKNQYMIKDQGQQVVKTKE